MTDNTFCKELSGESCSLVGERCFRIQAGERCEYIEYYKLLKQIGKDTPAIATRARTSMIDPLLASWKKYALHPLPGVKNVVASPLEREVRAILKSELEPLGVAVYDTGKKYRIWGDIAIIADGLVEKEGFPTSIISVKTWLAEGQIRETFAYAYWAKTWLGRKQIRVYQVAILKTSTKGKTIEGLIEICKPYLDGVFYLTEAPYIDDLIKELKEIYS
ncbi:MAG: hypothetical protein KAW00_06045 [Dehalococcoidia bacterium]|nr:hypothetical protein [Dehalococcoidia bacterium]